MVCPVVAELHLDGLRAGGESQDLVPEADAEYRNLLLENLPHGLDGIGAWLRIAGAVREEHAVRVHGKDVLCGSGCRNNCETAAVLRENTEDVALDAEIIGYDVELGLLDVVVALAELPGADVPLIGLGGRDYGGKIHSLESRELARLLQGLLLGRVLAGDQAAPLRALGAENAGQLSGVDVADGDYAVLLQIVRKRTG